MPDMLKKYNEEVRGELQKKMGYKNVMQIPKLTKIVISSGMSSGCERDAFAEAKKQISFFTVDHEGELRPVTIADRVVGQPAAQILGESPAKE